MASSNSPSDIESGVNREDSAQPGARKSADARATPALDDGATTRRDKDLPAQGHALMQGVKRRVPGGVRRRYGTAVSWLRGPDPPRPWKIRPLLPRVQQLPLRLVDRLLPRRWQRAVVLLVFYVCWIATFGAVMHKSSAVDDIGGQGSPFLVGCGGSFWSQNNGCGLDGIDCQPFANSSFAFRCPASCSSQQVLNPRFVGATEVIYETLVVGGATPNANGGSDGVSGFVYRADSFICSAAIHAGVISNSQGGCGVVSLVGQQSNYPSVVRNGIRSVGFNSTFPSSFTFEPGSGMACRDLRWQLLAVSVVYTAVLSLFTKSPSVFFYSVFIACYLQSALATSTPRYADIYSLVSTALGGLLPALFIAQVMFTLYMRRTLLGLTAQVEKTVLWLGPCWVGSLADYTFELIPLSRLTSHDIKQQPGAIASLVVIVLVIFVVFVGQAWTFRREGRLLRYLGLYVCLGVCIGLLAAVPNESLRIHHYILGLLLIPGTSIQTRPSLVYQGILVGLFVNGVAKWGFDSILQTAAALQGDAIMGTVLPTVTASNITASNITFSWPSVPDGYAGTSILVNDVERYRSSQGEQSLTWQRSDGDASLPEYFRFAYYALSAAYGLQSGDYTKAGTWYANGTWQQMEPGAS
ncbi:hypothetical protein KVR01_004465 [Diaporthe batatas]|uniref:uncharacterized protein n=1 Tax=Diaporthe batatas TaxID=748121 RepID=UPI001D04EA29|nr:uncharacterized protein KVR01_004465 [Diaporthe batatas]KAG8165913.1 hypothetical protein KVR01_004465 [Diaporthe batatas]